MANNGGNNGWGAAEEDEQAAREGDAAQQAAAGGGDGGVAEEAGAKQMGAGDATRTMKYVVWMDAVSTTNAGVAEATMEYLEQREVPISGVPEPLMIGDETVPDPAREPAARRAPVDADASAGREEQERRCGLESSCRYCFSRHFINN